MVAWLCVVGALSGIVVALTVKIHFMHKSLQEICAFLQRYIENETNTLIDIPSNDHHIRMLADAINISPIPHRISMKYKSANCLIGFIP